MNTRLYRKETLDRVNSPEQLNDYIRVVDSGVWISLTAVILLLIGVVIWAVFGEIETTVETGAVAADGKVVCFVSDTDVGHIAVGMKVQVGGADGTVSAISETPFRIRGQVDDYILYLGGFSEGDFCYTVEVAAKGLSDGVYDAVITIDDIKPISFVIH